MDNSTEENGEKLLNNVQPKINQEELNIVINERIGNLESSANLTTRTADISLPDPFYDPQSSLSNPGGASVAPQTESTSSVLYESSNHDEASNSISGGNGFVEETFKVCKNGNISEKVFLVKPVI